MGATLEFPFNPIMTREFSFKTKAFIAKNALHMKKQSNQPRVIITRRCIMITW